MEMETAGRIFTGGGRAFRHLRWKRVRPLSILVCVSITRNIQRTADIRKEPKGQPVNMSILRIATPL